MKIKTFVVMSALLLVFSFSYATEKRPVDVKQDDKCSVCGMFVAKYKNWIAQIIFSDGTYAVFDGPRDMFRYYLNLRKYNPSKTSRDISSIYVTEYYSTKLMDAQKMFFVQGSDVNGPMGSEFIPVAEENNAKEFLKDHSGKKIMRFGDIRPEDLQ